MADNTEEQSFHGQGTNFFCDLKIKGQQVISSNILHLCIKEWIFDIVPRIEIMLNDDGMFTEAYPMQDGDIISIELKKNSLDTPAIKLEFSLIANTVGAISGGKSTQIIIVGALNVKDFYSPMRSRAFPNKNSKDVLTQILVSDGGSKLTSSVSTVDVMTWLQIQMPNIEMCKHILKRSYIPNDTMFLFADTTGKFTYTSFETEVKKEVSGIARFDQVKFDADGFEDNADYKDYWFNTYNIYDFNPYVNMMRNYGVTYTYFDTTKGKVSNKITTTAHPLTEFSAKDKTKINSISHDFSLGYLPVGNVHPKYYDGIVQNEYYKHNYMSGFMLELNINSIAKPKLLSVVTVEIPSVLGHGSNDALSGDYLVAGVVHDIGRGDVYKKRMALIRNGFDKTQAIKVPTLAR